MTGNQKRIRMFWAAVLAVCLMLGAVGAQAAGIQNMGKNTKKTWSGIVDVIAGEDYTIGLRSDGTVAFTGNDYDGAGKRIAKWSGIKRIEKIYSTDGVYYIVGYKADGSLMLESMHDWKNDRFSEHWKEQFFSSWKNVTQLYIGNYFSLGLRADGTVLCFAANTDGETIVKKVCQWDKITQLITDGYSVVIGLKDDDSIVSNLSDKELQEMGGYWGGSWGPRSDWRNVETLVYQGTGMYAIKRDGTVLGMQHLDGWTNIASVCCAPDSMYGLRRDGSVATLLPAQAEYGYEDERLVQVSQWKNIVQLVLDGWGYLPIGLCKDGTVRAVTTAYEGEPYGEWDFSGWTKVKALYGSTDYSIGIRTDGTVLVTGGEWSALDYLDEIARWTDITAIYAGGSMDVTDHIIGLKSDGTLVAAGNNDQGQCNVTS